MAGGVALLPGIHSTEEALQLLDHKLKQLKHEYDLYFRGSRPRAPAMLRGEAQRIVNVFSNVPIQNTALRFKFNSLCARFFTFRRQWDTLLRQIEEGTYKPHQFKAALNARRARASAPAESTRKESPEPPGAAAAESEFFREYVAARSSCGEDVRHLTPERLQGLLEQKRAAIQRRYGCESVRFRVVVEEGRTKLKATPVRKG